MLADPSGEMGEGPLFEVMRFVSRYDLLLPPYPLFHFNLGAAMAIEKLCSAEIPAIFVSEHSCEAQVPQAFQPFLRLTVAGMPERIALRGHDEYTIQFSHLEKIASAYHYEVIRGPMADFIPLEMTDRLRCCLAAPAASTDENEVIRHFVEDLFKYEYLLLTKPKIPAQHKWVRSKNIS
jgi:hypothetical protein